jgi:drug/metabolite transporter (DMT)-like permease
MQRFSGVAGLWLPAVAYAAAAAVTVGFGLVLNRAWRRRLKPASFLVWLSAAFLALPFMLVSVGFIYLTPMFVWRHYWMPISIALAIFLLGLFGEAATAERRPSTVSECGRKNAVRR